MKIKNDNVEIQTIEAEGTAIKSKRGRKKKEEKIENVETPVVQKEEIPVTNEEDNEDVIEFEKELLNNIESWKREYKKIFKNEVDENILLWRRMKRSEYKEILKNTDGDLFAKQEAIVRQCILYPDIDEVNLLIEDNAGFATVMSEEILTRSGFSISFTEEM